LSCRSASSFMARARKATDTSMLANKIRSGGPAAVVRMHDVASRRGRSVRPAGPKTGPPRCRCAAAQHVAVRARSCVAICTHRRRVSRRSRGAEVASVACVGSLCGQSPGTASGSSPWVWVVSFQAGSSVTRSDCALERANIHFSPLMARSQSASVGILPQSSQTCCSPRVRVGTCLPSEFTIELPKTRSASKTPCAWWRRARCRKSHMNSLLASNQLCRGR